MIHVLDTRDIGVLGKFHCEFSGELNARTDTGIGVDNNRDRGLVCELPFWISCVFRTSPGGTR